MQRTSVNDKSRRLTPRDYRRREKADTASPGGLKPHWHHNVAGMRDIRRVNETTAVRVGQSQFDAISLDCAQSIQQIVDIEADLHFLALIADLDLILRLFLLRVVRLHHEQIRF